MFYSKVTNVFREYNDLQFFKKYQNLTIKMSVKNQLNLSDFYLGILNYSVGAHYLLKYFFDNFNFETLYFPKSCPIFAELSLIVFTKQNNLPRVCRFCPKILILAPRQLAVLKLNRYYIKFLLLIFYRLLLRNFLHKFT